MQNWLVTFCVFVYSQDREVTSYELVKARSKTEAIDIVGEFHKKRSSPNWWGNPFAYDAIIFPKFLNPLKKVDDTLVREVSIIKEVSA